MLEFKDIKIEDKAWVNKCLMESDYRGCEYSFGNMFIWQWVYGIKIAKFDEFCLIKNNNGFYFPAGSGDLKKVIEELRLYSKDVLGKNLEFCTMNKASADWLSENYGDMIEISTDRDLYDYIYERESLATLKGKKLHSKRNHINRFEENNWTYETINENNIADCVEMSKKWCVANNCEADEGKAEEMCAVNNGITNYFDLGFKGGLIRVDGEIQGFTFGEKLNSDTFVVHVEKAMTDYQGAYPAINKNFIEHECTDYEFINREEDMGEEGLRRAKLSYKPVFLEEKFKVNYIK